jgi:glycosyltransferase involved in cell wall biosynthesis
MDRFWSETNASASARERRPQTVSVVIPALNEERNIGWVLGRLPDCVDEVIVVDGRSTDCTIEVALATRPDARIVEEMTPGKGAALRAGFKHARGDRVVMLDADGSMEPAEIGRYLARLEQGFDLVKGSRFMPGGGTTDISRVRVIGNFGLLTLANMMYGCRFTELCYGYMAFRRSVIPLLRLTADGFEIETQIVANALRAGLRVAEVPSFEAARRFGESNLRTFRDGGRVLHELIKARLSVWPPAPLGPAPALPLAGTAGAALATTSPLASAEAPGATTQISASPSSPL